MDDLATVADAVVTGTMAVVTPTASRAAHNFARWSISRFPFSVLRAATLGQTGVRLERTPGQGVRSGEQSLHPWVEGSGRIHPPSHPGADSSGGPKCDRGGVPPRKVNDMP